VGRAQGALLAQGLSRSGRTVSTGSHRKVGKLMAEFTSSGMGPDRKLPAARTLLTTGMTYTLRLSLVEVRRLVWARPEAAKARRPASSVQAVVMETTCNPEIRRLSLGFISGRVWYDRLSEDIVWHALSVIGNSRGKLSHDLPASISRRLGRLASRRGNELDPLTLRRARGDDLGF